jgi:BirA family biotin operon repressor/biotin-[acetyl-CoA-carboxylase] ligase
MTAPRLSDEYRLVELDEIDSTNEQAKRLAIAGAEEGTLVWAHRQTAGRGRRGREWTSRQGNLFTSLIIRPYCAPLEAAQFTFAAALAVRDMVAVHLRNDIEVACKWPNDVLVEGRKVSGILLESSTAGKGNVEWLVLGVGINLSHHPARLEHAFGLGESARIKLEGGEYSGRFIGIDECGALRLKAEGCGEKLFSAGDVTFGESG